MDQLLVDINVGKWLAASRYLKSHQDDLGTDEWTAVEQLSDFWKSRPFNTSLVEEAEALISVLVSSDKLHSNNREIINKSKDFRGVASDMYTRDAVTYKQFQDALTKATGRKAPTPRPVRPPVVTVNPVNPVPEQKAPLRRPELFLDKIIVRNENSAGNPIGEEQILYSYATRNQGRRNVTLPYDTKYITVYIEYFVNNPGEGSSTVTAMLSGPGLNSEEYTVLQKSPWREQASLNVSGTRRLRLGGYGNEQGNSWDSGQYELKLYVGPILRQTAAFSIAPGRRTETVTYDSGRDDSGDGCLVRVLKFIGKVFLWLIVINVVISILGFIIGIIF